jgi:hypothetical protein
MKSFKQYLSESDPNSWNPMPGYSYNDQDPNLRSDEDAEKTKEWYKDVGDRGNNATYTYRGDTVFLSSEVDASGRPTGVKTSRESDETRARREEQEAADEADVINAAWDVQQKDAIRRQEEKDNARGGPGRLNNPNPVFPPIKTKNYNYPDLPAIPPWDPIRMSELA